MIITPVHTDSEQGRNQLNSIYKRCQQSDDSCRDAVTEILGKIQRDGDAAIVEYTRKFDCPDFDLQQLRVSDDEIKQAYSAVDSDFRDTLALAVDRIRSFHEHEKEESWIVTRKDGVITGRLVRPVDSAGLYVPGGQGGKTPLVSSVLMNGIPAGIAGVGRRVMVTPCDAGGSVSPALLVAAAEIGISEIYKIGSAWAIGALAYGTESIAPVDVIVGPGNRFVAEAKQQVTGMVGLDMIAGPSEVLIIADSSAKPAYIAADMLAQAEHDPQALAMVISTDEKIAAQVVEELEIQLARLSREEIARTSLCNRGVILIADSMDEAIDLANRIAAEHLELMVTEPWEMLPGINHAGAIFLGDNAPEAVGDYLAGPNHVLPTMGTARFSSALGVETFLKKSSVLSYSRSGFEKDSSHIHRLATLEGLTGHAASVSVRLKK